MKPIIYIAAPYSNGEMNAGTTPEKIIMDNIMNSLRVGNELADAGFIPFAGNLYHYWHLAYPRDYESWFEIVTAHLPYCKAVLRLEGKSSGADREVAMAKKLGIPVFYDIQTLITHFKIIKDLELKADEYEAEIVKTIDGKECRLKGETNGKN